MMAGALTEGSVGHALPRPTKLLDEVKGFFAAGVTGCSGKNSPPRKREACKITDVIKR